MHLKEILRPKGWLNNSDVKIDDLVNELEEIGCKFYLH